MILFLLNVDVIVVIDLKKVREIVVLSGFVLSEEARFTAHYLLCQIQHLRFMNHGKSLLSYKGLY